MHSRSITRSMSSPKSVRESGRRSVYHTMPCHAMPCHATCHAVPHRAAPRHATPHNINLPTFSPTYVLNRLTRRLADCRTGGLSCLVVGMVDSLTGWHRDRDHDPMTVTLLSGSPQQKSPEQTVSPLIDPSANKYDYLLVFTKIRKDKLITVDPKTGIKTVKDPELGGIVEDEEGAADGGLSAAICGCCDSMPTIGEGIPDDRRVYWSQVPFTDPEAINASEKWWRAIPGEKDAKDRGVEELKQAWMDHFKTDTVDPVSDRAAELPIISPPHQPHQPHQPHHQPPATHSPTHQLTNSPTPPRHRHHRHRFTRTRTARTATFWRSRVTSLWAR